MYCIIVNRNILLYFSVIKPSFDFNNFCPTMGKRFDRPEPRGIVCIVIAVKTIFIYFIHLFYRVSLYCLLKWALHTGALH